MRKSSIFTKIENKFKNATSEEITNLTIKARDELIVAIEKETGNREDALNFVLFAAIVGMLADGKICPKEKLLFKRVFQEHWGGDIKDLLSFAKDMGFAYIDGVLEENVAEQLDEIYGFYLLTDFYQDVEIDL